MFEHLFFIYLNCFLMILFSIGTGLECVGIVGLDLDYRWVDGWLWMLRSLQKQEAEGVGGGFARNRSDA